MYFFVFIFHICYNTIIYNNAIFFKIFMYIYIISIHLYNIAFSIKASNNLDIIQGMPVKKHDRHRQSCRFFRKKTAQ